MKPNKLKQKLLSGQVVFGSLVMLPEPSIVEILGYAGYDFAILDMEHSTMDMMDIQSLVRAAEAADITPIVRIGEKNYYSVSRALDSGALGIMVPQLTGPEEAKAIVEFTKYPPLGSRPTCPVVRTAQFTATSFPEHVEQSNRDIMVLALIEEPSAVDLIDQILAVAGIDVVIPGPADLATSLNVPGDYEHPLVIERVKKVIKTAVQKSKFSAGMYITKPEQAKRWLDEGVKLIVYGVDKRMIFSSYRDALSKLTSFLS